MKYEWRKHDKQVYMPKTTPSLIEVPSLQYITLHGKGNPNDKKFADAIGVLYSLSYAIKMLPKKGILPEGYYDYTVFPLEGIWHQENDSAIMIKDDLIYTIMIRQPDFVTTKIFNDAIDITKKKKLHPLLSDAQFQQLVDGLSVQMLHIGAYDDEPQSFEQMDTFCKENSLKRTSNKHREIYLTDARKVQEEKLKTVLRYFVAYI